MSIQQNQYREAGETAGRTETSRDANSPDEEQLFRVVQAKLSQSCGRHAILCVWAFVHAALGAMALLAPQTNDSGGWLLWWPTQFRGLALFLHFFGPSAAALLACLIAELRAGTSVSCINALVVAATTGVPLSAFAWFVLRLLPNPQQRADDLQHLLQSDAGIFLWVAHFVLSAIVLPILLRAHHGQVVHWARALLNIIVSALLPTDGVVRVVFPLLWAAMEGAALLVRRDAFLRERHAFHIARHLQESDQQKDDRLSFLSHEVRNPLTGVQGNLQLLQTTNLTREQKEYVSDAEAACAQMRVVVNDVLDLNKMEAGKMEPELRLVSTPDVIRTPLVQVRSLAAQRRITVVARMEANVPRKLRLDSSRVAQCIMNFLTNSFKFSPNGGTILLRVFLVSARCIASSDASSESETNAAAGLAANQAPFDHAICFAVSDEGEGIPPDALRKLFAGYSQASASIARTHGGTGLGLRIVQRIAQLMGGGVGASSVTGKGSTFFVILPCPTTTEQTRATVLSVPSSSPRDTAIRSGPTGTTLDATVRENGASCACWRNIDADPEATFGEFPNMIAQMLNGEWHTGENQDRSAVEHNFTFDPDDRSLPVDFATPQRTVPSQAMPRGEFSQIPPPSIGANQRCRHDSLSSVPCNAALGSVSLRRQGHSAELGRAASERGSLPAPWRGYTLPAGNGRIPVGRCSESVQTEPQATTNLHPDLRPVMLDPSTAQGEESLNPHLTETSNNRREKEKGSGTEISGHDTSAAAPSSSTNTEPQQRATTSSRHAPNVDSVSMAVPVRPVHGAGGTPPRISRATLPVSDRDLPVSRDKVIQVGSSPSCATGELRSCNRASTSSSAEGATVRSLGIALVPEAVIHRPELLARIKETVHRRRERCALSGRPLRAQSCTSAGKIRTRDSARHISREDSNTASITAASMHSHISEGDPFGHRFRYEWVIPEEPYGQTPYGKTQVEVCSSNAGSRSSGATVRSGSGWGGRSSSGARSPASRVAALSPQWQRGTRRNVWGSPVHGAEHLVPSGGIQLSSVPESDTSASGRISAMVPASSSGGGFSAVAHPSLVPPTVSTEWHHETVHGKPQGRLFGGLLGADDPDDLGEQAKWDYETHTARASHLMLQWSTTSRAGRAVALRDWNIPPAGGVAATRGTVEPVPLPQGAVTVPVKTPEETAAGGHAVSSSLLRVCRREFDLPGAVPGDNSLSENGTRSRSISSTARVTSSVPSENDAAIEKRVSLGVTHKKVPHDSHDAQDVPATVGVGAQQSSTGEIAGAARTTLDGNLASREAPSSTTTPMAPSRRRRRKKQKRRQNPLEEQPETTPTSATNEAFHHGITPTTPTLPGPWTPKSVVATPRRISAERAVLDEALRLKGQRQEHSRILRVLCVAEQHPLRQLVQMTLLEWGGMDVTLATNASDAMLVPQQSLSAAEPLDLICIGSDVAWRSAVTLVRTARSSSRVPVLLITDDATASGHTLLTSSDTSGPVDATMALPVDPMELCLVVERLVRVRDVWIVDDEAINQRIFSRILTKGSGHRCRTVGSGREFLSWLKDCELESDPCTPPGDDSAPPTVRHSAGMPDLILLDLHLGDMTGLECLRQLRASHVGQTVPVIAVSGDSDLSTRQQCFDAGMQGFLGKPVERNEMIQLAASLTMFPGTNAHHRVQEEGPMETCRTTGS